MSISKFVAWSDEPFPDISKFRNVSGNPTGTFAFRLPDKNDENGNFTNVITKTIMIIRTSPVIILLFGANIDFAFCPIFFSFFPLPT